MNRPRRTYSAAGILSLLVLGACASASQDGDDDPAPDAAIVLPDAPVGTIDAAGASPDAAAATPDAAVSIDAAASSPDAAAGSPDATPTPDAMAGTPDATPTPDAAPPPDAMCSTGVVNLLSNPSFDSGPGGGWVESGTYPIVQLEGDPNLPSYLSPIPSPTYGAWLGGYDSANDILYQDVVVPAGATNLQVQFTRWIETQDSLLTDWDYFYAELQTTGGSVLELYQPGPVGWTYSNVDEQRSWVPVTWTPSGSYAGQTIRLAFRVTTDLIDSTSFFVDSVAVNVTVVTCP